MSLHRYPPGSIYADYARAGFGLLLTVTPLLLLDLSGWVAVPLAICAALFLAFAIKAGLRQASAIELTDDAVVRHGPLQRTIRLGELDTVKLSYYATRRERGSGWMQLSLRGGGKRISAESTLSGFDQVVETAASAARQNGVVLGRRTLDNIEALGIEVPSQTDSLEDAPGRIQN